MHLDDERIQRTLHNELSAGDRDAVESHLTSCESCRKVLEAAAREEERIFALLRSVDHESPAVDPISLIRPSRNRPALRQRWAAVAIVLLALAGVAYAVPGSPVRAWLDRITGRTPPSIEAPDLPSDTSSEVAVSGISVAPTMRLSIRFIGLTTQHEALVTIAETQEVQIRAIGDAASFSTDADVLTVRPGPNAKFEVELPREAPWIEILAQDRLLLRKEGDRVVTTAPIDAAGSYHLKMRASSP